ncbi:uncharacterized protein LOC133531292 [Cydia pomonella]|uniref:uncharacterized protein LOC133531292 n=1 Tax=Cydia pomonella TaxID=82600 RepID=UPI002ADDB619|nr:uncharacterized protein LOC133531292 [Cydia pomonella]
MEMIHQCHCCLRRPPSKDMETPYTRLGITEIYSVMLEECFAIDVTVGKDGKSGICEKCVGQLREACHFKLLVQHSQAKLRESLEMEYHVKDKEPPAVPSEEGTCDNTSLHEELIMKSECEDSDAANNEDCMSPASGDVAGAETEAARAEEQLARACCVRLERLRAAPPASRPRPAAPRRARALRGAPASAVRRNT